MARPIIHHRTPQFSALFEVVCMFRTASTAESW